MVTDIEYCCAGMRHLGRHTEDCEQPRTIARSALPISMFGTDGASPTCGPSCACVGGLACDRPAYERTKTSEQ